jgi:hypothetical protein
MEPDSSWRLAFLFLGGVMPFGIIAADIAWLGADAMVVLACLLWLGFFLFVVEGVTE